MCLGLYGCDPLILTSQVFFCDDYHGVLEKVVFMTCIRECFIPCVIPWHAFRMQDQGSSLFFNQCLGKALVEILVFPSPTGYLLTCFGFFVKLGYILLFHVVSISTSNSIRHVYLLMSIYTTIFIIGTCKPCPMQENVYTFEVSNHEHSCRVLNNTGVSTLIIPLSVCFYSKLRNAITN